MSNGLSKEAVLSDPALKSGASTVSSAERLRTVEQVTIFVNGYRRAKSIIFFTFFLTADHLSNIVVVLGTFCTAPRTYNKEEGTIW